jgi:hypothetical protein
MSGDQSYGFTRHPSASTFPMKANDNTSKWISKRCVVSTKPLARQTLRVMSLGC